MPRTIRFFSLFVSLSFAFLLSACRAPAPGTEKGENPEVSLRHFDTAPARAEGIRLAILYPSTGSLNALRTLREKGLFSPDELEVVGVFHEAERTEYDRSIAMVEDESLDWIRFHRLSGELNRDNLFGNHGLSGEFRDIFEKSDGIIFFGGADIPPYLYGEETSLLTGIRTPYRHFLELSFMFHLLGGFQDKDFTPFLASAPEFPVLGICLGEQTLNVGTGGTMVQDVAAEIYGARSQEEVIALGRESWHTNPYARLFPEKRLFSYNLHPIRLLPESLFIQELGFSPQDTPFIMSAHHQAVEKLGRGLYPIATSLDGKVVEAIAHKDFPHVLGIQFHPEFPVLWDPEARFKMTPEDTSEFSAFSILQDNPPSKEFHRKLWAWFTARLEGSRASRR
ncbi:MAG: gamma-glutamyl-gamma-aminobutyrate hydrolase family protein [Candidatus Aminicenantaceae bacterium]